MNGRCFPPASTGGAKAIPLFGGKAPGTVDSRHHRIGVRRRFVAMKDCFMRAAAHVPGSAGVALQQRVRRAQDPFELLALQLELLDGLNAADTRSVELRLEVESQLDRLFAGGAEGLSR